VLYNIDRNVSTDQNATVVQEQRTTNIKNIYANTAGRLQGGDKTKGLEVGFEQKADGSIPTIKFILGKDDRYYFDYRIDNGQKYIMYDGSKWTVRWEGTEEPYLNYQRTLNEQENVSTMKGLK
jgi:hypothetical protein